MVGVVILNYNSANDTIRCINSIKENTTIPYHIYIVEGCSQDNSYEHLVGYFKDQSGINLIRSTINGGYSYGNNIGAIKAIEDGADAILIINPDVILKNSAINLMYATLLREKDLAVVGPRILNNHDEDMQFASRLYTLNSFLCSKKPLAYFENSRLRKGRYHHFDFNKDYSFRGMVSGCCFMIKAQDLKSIDFFDTNLFLYYEEDVLAYKLFQTNRLTKILAGAVVYHMHSKIINNEGAAFIRYHRFYSSQYVLKKYARINKPQFIFVSLFHILPFTINAIFYKSYRKIYNSFVKKIYSLYKQQD